MAYWRMQLHPAEPSESVKGCVESLAAGYIGLDFATDVGDLMRLDPLHPDAGREGLLSVRP